MDWPAVKIGAKTEFRTKPRESSRLLSCYTPTPVVAYAVNGRGEKDYELMVLESRRYEPLFVISQDQAAIAREGFETYDHFRRYWRKRCKGIYRPGEMVWVWTVRPWQGKHDAVRHGVAVLAHLYEDFLAPLSALRDAA